MHLFLLLNSLTQDCSKTLDVLEPSFTSFEFSVSRFSTTVNLFLSVCHILSFGILNKIFFLSLTGFKSKLLLSC